MEDIKRVDQKIFELIKKEIEREEFQLQMIASENYTSKAVLSAQGSILTNKYAEGYSGKRYYQGCSFIDEIEKEAIDRAKELFKSEHANVQPHSGSSANMAAYLSVLNIGDTILGMDLAAGGHLSHGANVNFSGMCFKTIFYGVNKETKLIDYNEILKIAKQYKPKLIIAGASSYPRAIDFKSFKEIADEVGAYLIADIAHISGLIVAGLHQSPVEYAQIVTSSTHKALRGPRGGLILCKEKYSKLVDEMVFPGIQGGPLMHVIAAKAVAFKEAMSADFKEYQKQIVLNAKCLADELIKRGYDIVTGGTDNHLILVDLTKDKLTGKESAFSLEQAGIVVNKNRIPFDPLGPAVSSGIRIGTPAITTRGMKEKEIKIIAGFIDIVLKNINNRQIISNIRDKVTELCKKFPVYSEN